MAPRKKASVEELRIPGATPKPLWIEQLPSPVATPPMIPLRTQVALEILGRMIRAKSTYNVDMPKAALRYADYLLAPHPEDSILEPPVPPRPKPVSSGSGDEPDADLLEAIRTGPPVFG